MLLQTHELKGYKMKAHFKTILGISSVRADMLISGKISVVEQLQSGEMLYQGIFDNIVAFRKWFALVPLGEVVVSYSEFIRRH